MRHVISILIENEAGALSRVVGLFSQRGYNIDSLTVAPTDDATLSRCTILPPEIKVRLSKSPSSCISLFVYTVYQHF